MTFPSTTDGDRDRFTPAGLRVLDRARRLAVERNDRTIEPPHVLQALVDDESHAAELLRECGFDPSNVERLLASLPVAPPTGDDDSMISRGTDVELALLEATRFARLADPDGTIGTEHLLFGLVVVASPVAEALSAHGLDEPFVTRLARGRETTIGEPLPVDFEIRFDVNDRDSIEPSRVNDPSENDPVEPRIDHPNDGALPVHRILDAAANRAREGLRVAEDHARFLLDDAHLVGRLKALRHDLADVSRGFDEVSLLRARDTPGDVGREVTTDAEHRRAGPDDVLRAAFKRAEEALRSLEEFGKVLDPAAGPRLEAIRYRLYTVEKSALTTVVARERFGDRHLYLLLTRDLCRQDPEQVLRRALVGGVSVVQVREKSLPDRELLEWCRVVRRVTREANALFIVNDRPDLAVLCEADGVHVGQEELGVRESRRILGPSRLVGVSTHDLAQARQAVDDGADYIGVGPTFPSGTKSFDAFAGLDFVRAIAGEIGLPAYAIGGIDATNAADVVAAGIRRVAVTAAVCSAADPARAAERLVETLVARP